VQSRITLMDHSEEKDAHCSSFSSANNRPQGIKMCLKETESGSDARRRLSRKAACSSDKGRSLLGHFLKWSMRGLELQSNGCNLLGYANRLQSASGRLYQIIGRASRIESRLLSHSFKNGGFLAVGSAGNTITETCTVGRRLSLVTLEVKKGRAEGKRGLIDMQVLELRG